MILVLIIIYIIIIISACPVLAEEQYIKRDDRVNLDNEHWYEHVPELVETIREGKVTSANRHNHPQ